uniref:Uncharacterized protein n=1 Tax=viral metagenome TaxID=1070528 RepID=A0A6C0CRS6_9ZZZZ
MQANIDSVPQINDTLARFARRPSSPHASIVNNLDYDAIPPTFKKLRGCGCCHYHSYGINEDKSQHNTYIDFCNFKPDEEDKTKCSCRCVDNANLIRFAVEKYYPEMLRDLQTA